MENLLQSKDTNMKKLIFKDDIEKLTCKMRGNSILSTHFDNNDCTQQKLLPNTLVDFTLV